MHSNVDIIFLEVEQTCLFDKALEKKHLAQANKSVTASAHLAWCCFVLKVQCPDKQGNSLGSFERNLPVVNRNILE